MVGSELSNKVICTLVTRKQGSRETLPPQHFEGLMDVLHPLTGSCPRHPAHLLHMTSASFRKVLLFVTLSLCVQNNKAK